ncbi:MAG: metal ABC transporter permease [Planctomycetaceae bacterium]|nr:metal ABC transporter permease [Planctomycetaceae bacterium]
MTTVAADVTPSPSSTLQRVLGLRDYNTRVVLLGTTLLGISGGVIGVFTLLRKRSLIADVVGHSALPGIAIAFLLTEIIRPGTGKNVPLLMLGATLSGLLGAVLVLLITRSSRIRSDAAMAVVLSTFYGLGTALLTVVQHVPTASAAGLKDYLNGKTASLVAGDVWIFAIASACLLCIATVLFKEFSLVCFDEDYAASEGWPVWSLDGLLTALVVGITILGMQSVGLLLVVAVLIIPASAARFWSHDIRRMTVIAGIIGGLAAATGTILSALGPRLAAGAVIVLCGTGLFLLSMLFGWRRGWIWTWVESRRMQRRIGRHDLLRATYEIIESQHAEGRRHVPTDAELLNAPVDLNQLVGMRTWSRSRVQHLIRSACHESLLIPHRGAWRLTPEGAALARRAVRNHRLWELYLITFADVAPSRVDRAADRIEHVLEPETIRLLELRLETQQAGLMPTSPHD